MCIPNDINPQSQQLNKNDLDNIDTTEYNDTTQSVESIPSPKPLLKFEYVFGESCEADFFGLRSAINVIKTLEADIKWEDARFLIERRHGLFTTKQCKPGVTRSYIEGYFFVPNWRSKRVLINRDYIMKPTDKVVVVRKPLPAGSNYYIPLRFRAEMEQHYRKTMSADELKKEENIKRFIKHIQAPKFVPGNVKSPECRFKGPEYQVKSPECQLQTSHPLSSMTLSNDDDKMLQIAKVAENEDMYKILEEKMMRAVKRPRFEQYHISDLKSDQSLQRPPPPMYVCHRCNKPGHWKNQCPTLGDPGFVPVVIPKNPSGIPKTMLKEVVSDEDKKNAMFIGGKHVVYTQYKSK